MKTYKFSAEETTAVYVALNFACFAAKKELEDDIKLDIAMSCKSIVEQDKANYATLCKLREIARELYEMKIEGE